MASDLPSADTHDKDTSTAAGVPAKVGSTKGEDGRIHGSHEEEDDDDASNARSSVRALARDESRQSNAASGVDHEDEVRLQDVSHTSSDEATDSEDDKTVGEQAGAFFRRVRSGFSGIVDEKGCDGDLSADIAELSGETEHHVVLLEERFLLDDVAILIQGHAELFRVSCSDGC